MTESAMQVALTRAVTTLHEATSEFDEAAAMLDERYAHRLRVYQKSYRGRLLHSLGEALFAPVARLCGAELVAQTLALYLTRCAPSQSCMALAVAGLPAFLRERGEGWAAAMLADLYQLCLAQWDLMTGIDPTEDAGLPCRFVAASPRVDLFSAWQAADATAQRDQSGPAPRDLTSFESPRADGVLLLKVSPVAVVTVRVPAQLSGLAQRLTAGEAALEALDGLLAELADDAVEALDEAEIRGFFGALGAAAADFKPPV